MTEGLPTIETDNADKEREEEIRQKILEKLKGSKAVIVNVDHLAEAEAGKAADAAMTESKGRKGFWKKLWKHTFFDEYYRQKEANIARSKIKDTENIYAGRNLDKVAHDHAMEGIVERFASEYEEVLNKDEQKKTLENTDPAVEKAKKDIKKIIIDYAQGTTNEEVFNNEKSRIINSLNKEEILQNVSSYTDNLFEMAKNAKLAMEHGAKMEELDFDFNLIIGKAKSSLKTEAHFNLVDKGVDWMKKTRIGKFISPTVILTAVGIYATAISALKIGSRSKAAQIASLGGAAVVAGALAGLNESQRVTAERAQHALERAEGGTFETGSTRREQMERYQYEMLSAKDLTAQLRESMFTTDKDGKEVAKDIKIEDLTQIFANLASIEARNALNDKKKIDLISYSKIENVERERTEMAILLARSKVELRKKLEADLNLKNGLPAGETMETYLAKQVQEVIEDSLLGGEKGVTAQDKAFRGLKRRRVATKVVATIATGLVAGAFFQEMRALASDHSQGVIEGMMSTENHGVTTQTPLEHLRGWIAGHSSHMATGNGLETHLGDNAFKLPEGTSILQNLDGTFNIMRGDQIVSDHIPLHFGANGLDAESISRLGEDGIVANTTHNVINSTVETTISSEDYVKNHPDETKHISRGWYDNNTPKPVFDHNELKLSYGGVGGTGIDAQGNYVLNISHMLKGGSFHEGFSVDAQEKIQSGGLKMLLSLSQGTQHHVFEVPIDVSGNAVIDPNSEVGKLFFSTENGHTIFKGRFAEVAETFGLKDGVEHVKILSTYEGPGVETIKDIVPSTTNASINHLNLPLKNEMPWFIPIPYRKPLGPIKENTTVLYSGSSLNEIQLEFIKKGITQDPYKKIKTKNGEEIWVDEDNKKISRDGTREKARLVAYLKKQDQEYLEELKRFNKGLKPMSKDCRISVIIPARLEEQNLKNLLDQYIQQEDNNGNPINKDLFEINILVNRKEGEEGDKSMEVIDKWKKENPGHHVNAVDIVFPKSKANVGMARKYITDLSLLRSTERRTASGPLYIESEDADLVSVDRRTVNKLIADFDGEPHLDVLRGIQDRQPEIMSQNDLFFFERRLWDIGEVLLRDESLRSDRFDNSSFVWNRVISGGWNTAYTAEAYAQINGYVSDTIGEDMKIGQKISVLRGNGNKINTYTATTSGLRSNSSPRRFIDAMVKHENPYDNFEDQSMKRKSLTELMMGLKQYEKILPEHKKRYAAGINTLYSFMKGQMGTGRETRRVMQRTLFYVGLKENEDYVFTKDDNVKITEKVYKKIGEMLAKYRKDEKWKLGYRRQNSPLSTKITKKRKK